MFYDVTKNKLQPVYDVTVITYWTQYDVTKIWLGKTHGE